MAVALILSAPGQRDHQPLPPHLFFQSPFRVRASGWAWSDPRTLPGSSPTWQMGQPRQVPQELQRSLVLPSPPRGLDTPTTFS